MKAAALGHGRGVGHEALDGAEALLLEVEAMHTFGRRTIRLWSPEGRSVDAVIDAIVGISVPNLTGGYSTMMPNHHITKPVLIGEIQDDGQFEIVWETDGLVVGDAWSDLLPSSKDVIADWTAPIRCGNYNTETKACGAQ